MARTSHVNLPTPNLRAAPAAPQRDAVTAWGDAFNGLERQLDRWADRIAYGKDPLSPGERVKLQSLITAAQAQLGMGPKEAQIAAGVWQASLAPQQASLKAALDSIPEHAVRSAQESAAMLGWDNVPNKNAVLAVINNEVGQLTGDYARLSTWAQQRLAEDLATAVATGQHPRELAKAVKGTVEEWFRSGQARSVMIARTNLARAYDLSSQSVYKSAYEKGLVKGWRWVAHGKNTCEVCATLDGMVFPVEQDTFRHPNCTCQNVPVLEDEDMKVGERYAPRPGTDMENLELYTSKDGWTSWRLKPKDQRVKPKGKTPRKAPKPKVVVEPPVVTAPPVLEKPKIISPAAKAASQKSGASIPQRAGFKQVTDDWQDNPFTVEATKSLPDYFAERLISQRRWFYDEGSDIGVSVPNTVRVSDKNLDLFLNEVNDAVEIARKTMPLRNGSHRRMQFHVESKGMKNANAYTYLGHDQVFVNKTQLSLVGNAKKKLEKQFLKRWSVSSTDDRPVLRTLVHEMGHDSDSKDAAWAARREALYRKWVYEGADERGVLSIKEAVQYIGESKRARRGLRVEDVEPLDATDGPTVYARTNSTEMFAEAFAIWHVDGPDAPWLSPLVRKWITEFAEEFGWTR